MLLQNLYDTTTSPRSQDIGSPSTKSDGQITLKKTLRWNPELAVLEKRYKIQKKINKVLKLRLKKKLLKAKVAKIELLRHPSTRR